MLISCNLFLIKNLAKQEEIKELDSDSGRVIFGGKICFTEKDYYWREG